MNANAAWAMTRIQKVQGMVLRLEGAAAHMVEEEFEVISTTEFVYAAYR